MPSTYAPKKSPPTHILGIPKVPCFKLTRIPRKSPRISGCYRSLFGGFFLHGLLLLLVWYVYTEDMKDMNQNLRIVNQQSSPTWLLTSHISHESWVFLWPNLHHWGGTRSAGGNNSPEMTYPIDIQSYRKWSGLVLDPNIPIKYLLRYSPGCLGLDVGTGKNIFQRHVYLSIS